MNKRQRKKEWRAMLRRITGLKKYPCFNSRRPKCIIVDDPRPAIALTAELITKWFEGKQSVPDKCHSHTFTVSHICDDCGDSLENEANSKYES